MSTIPRTEDLAVLAAEALDALVTHRAVNFPVHPAELDAALRRLKIARRLATSAIALFATALRQRHDDPVAQAFHEHYDLAQLDRFGAMVEHGAERLEVDIELAASLRRYAAEFNRETYAPEAAE